MKLRFVISAALIALTFPSLIMAETAIERIGGAQLAEKCLNSQGKKDTNLETGWQIGYIQDKDCLGLYAAMRALINDPLVMADPSWAPFVRQVDAQSHMWDPLHTNLDSQPSVQKDEFKDVSGWGAIAGAAYGTPDS